MVVGEHSLKLVVLSGLALLVMLALLLKSPVVLIHLAQVVVRADMLKLRVLIRLAKIMARV